MAIQKKLTTGFSLVELSIVLVILGLLTGGILAGQSLIRAAELRSISQESAKFTTAILTFRDKYIGLPGDLTNATSFWGNAGTGTIGGECTDNAANTGSGTQTCNGNGNSQIGSTSPTIYERFRLYQHLANAGLLEGTYTGVTGSGGTNHFIPGTNAPASRIASAGWSIAYSMGNAGSTMDYTDLVQRHYAQIGATSTTSSPNGKLLKPEEAWNIDVKTDDGVPGTGNTTIKYWDDCTLAANFGAVTSGYDLAKTTPECAVKFHNNF